MGGVPRAPRKVRGRPVPHSDGSAAPAPDRFGRPCLLLLGSPPCLWPGHARGDRPGPSGRSLSVGLGGAP
eukprot:12445031-Alexandrium_andersonii.AAC.1